MRKLTICGINIAEYAIVLNPIPQPAEKTAAEFLQRVIKTACGVELPISASAENGIYIGTRGECDKVKLDGFRMTTDDKNVYLDGNIPRGTLYAAFDFAEKYLDHRYFAADPQFGNDCETISTEGDADVPCGLDIVDNPVMEARRSDCYTHMRSAEFSAHLRLNDCMPCKGEEWGGVTNLTGACHTFGKLLPGDQYFAEHPEYYSFRHGERIPCNGGGGPGQLCLSNPDVLRIVTEKVLAELRANPGQRVVEISQADSSSYCTCEHCAAVDEEEGSPSGSIIRFVNAVGEAVEKEFPNVLIQTFAYSYSRVPPKKTKARDNVIIRYCTMSDCCRHAINDPDCPMNSARPFSEMEGWKKMSSHMSIWDYITDWDCYIAPFPNLLSMLKNARYYADCNVRFVLAECNADNAAGGAYADLKAYLIGKLLWNPYMTEEEYSRHIAEFLQGFYGKGWREIAGYIGLEYEATEDRCVTCTDRIDIAFRDVDYDEPRDEMLERWRSYEAKPYQDMWEDHCLIGIVNRMDEAKGYFDRAYAMAETDTERMHIERSRMAIDYLDLFCSGKKAENMTEAERAAYEADCARFYEKKEKYHFYWNLHTGLNKFR